MADTPDKCIRIFFKKLCVIVFSEVYCEDIFISHFRKGSPVLVLYESEVRHKDTGKFLSNKLYYILSNFERERNKRGGEGTDFSLKELAQNFHRFGTTRRVTSSKHVFSQSPLRCVKHEYS